MMTLSTHDNYLLEALVLSKMSLSVTNTQQSRSENYMYGSRGPYVVTPWAQPLTVFLLPIPKEWHQEIRFETYIKNFVGKKNMYAKQRFATKSQKKN